MQWHWHPTVVSQVRRGLLASEGEERGGTDGEEMMDKGEK
jgi:hypothetical protein